jgi:hypothetical protein
VLFQQLICVKIFGLRPTQELEKKRMGGTSYPTYCLGKLCYPTYGLGEIELSWNYMDLKI